MPKGKRSIERTRVVVRGAVQGVGFRPFVFRLASGLDLRGWVKNTTAGVVIDVDGTRDHLDDLVARLVSEAPPAAYIQGVETTYLDPAGHKDFKILESEDTGTKTAIIPPDLATCPDCLRELFDPSDRRYRYPFINCTNCGPRYSIITDLPYDRPNTTMSGFRQCPACKAEYDAPTNRRFHAQPNACPTCGPSLKLWNIDGWALAGDDDALKLAVDGIRRGKIVAAKGIGGYQLLVDARNEDAVSELRRRKHRAEKPLALMLPNLAHIEEICVVSPVEARILQTAASPIVLLERLKRRSEIADAVAPENPSLGVMLPYTPMHHLLMAELGFPIVATSANLSDEPICIDDREALHRLSGIADLFLVHDRPIARHVDDSVVRVVMNRELPLRRARGYAPLPIELPPNDETILAYGAHQKCVVALTVGRQAIVSQHIGDIETAAATDAHRRVCADLPRMYGSTPQLVVCDKHPDYATTRLANRSRVPVARVQHHFAHVLACMADNELTGPVLGVAWDGTGYGEDGTIWGGEFLLVDDHSDEYQRIGHLRPFVLPGGEHAVRQPRRTALALLRDVFGDAALSMTKLPPIASFSQTEIGVITSMIEKRLNSPSTTSAGRLFDGVAALVGLRQRIGFEGQAAMLLEYAALECPIDGSYPVEIDEVDGRFVIDWRSTIRCIVNDLRDGCPIPRMASMFHNALVEGIVEVAKRCGETDRIALTGGCFQSKYLTERSVKRLREVGLTPYWHQRIPPNDGGIALGQIAAALRRTKECVSQSPDSLPRSAATIR